MAILGVEHGTPLDNPSKHPVTTHGGKLLLSAGTCYNPPKYYDKNCSKCCYNLDCCYPKKRGGVKYVQWSDGSWHPADEQEPPLKVHRNPSVSVVRSPVIQRNPVALQVPRIPTKAPVRTPVRTPTKS